MQSTGWNIRLLFNPNNSVGRKDFVATGYQKRYGTLKRMEYNMKSLLIFFCLMLLLITGCAQHMPISVGMTNEEIIEIAGEPVVKWVGTNNIECWKYEISGDKWKKNGRWYVILRDRKVIKVRPRRRNISSLEIGLPEAAAIEILGDPTSVAAQGDSKYLIYIIKIARRETRDHYVRIVNGTVESYGQKGDFDSTKPEEKTLNVNIKTKTEK